MDASSTTQRRSNPGRAIIVPAVLEHARHIGLYLRGPDREELTAQSPEVSCEDTVVASFAVSAPLCFTLLWDGNPVAIFGVSATEEEGVGSVWMLGTDGILSAAGYLARFTTQWVEWMNTIYPFLSNQCSASNTVSIAWLKHSGFEFGDPHDSYDIPFIPFWRTPQCAIPSP